MADVRVTLISCDGCSSKHHPNLAQLYEHRSSLKTMSFCGDECAHKHLGIKPTTAPLEQTKQVGAPRDRSAAAAAAASKYTDEQEFAGFDEVEQTLASAQRDAARATEPDTDASSGSDSESSSSSSTLR